MKQFIFLALPLVMVACASSDKNVPMEAMASLSSPSLKSMQGDVQMEQTKMGIKVTANVTGLKPNSVHGFHIHETGKCEGPDFKSAGGHYNPHEKNHAGPAASEKHFGDLGNLVANAQGEARTEVVIKTKNQEAMKKVIGKAVIVHAKADDLFSQPTGDAGDRMACGIIQEKSLQ